MIFNIITSFNFMIPPLFLKKKKVENSTFSYKKHQTLLLLCS
ncbi:hypothetical protein HMPREF1049_0116 [Fusobacterium necrophorum subsp. funduliforme ATCC 51357]|nr:hypothetical protein HMPREF1049_0116 [Fusobacterium necrophorum subsp. funduliforme ATCC 51357]